MKDSITYNLIPIGTRIYNRGDGANIPHYGTITEIRISKWGINYEITPDVKAEKKPYKVSSCMIKDYDTGNGLSRIVTDRAHEEYTLKVMEQMDARLKQLRSGATQ